jgi:predicted GIY-YIG superfamily endonuclease
MFACYIILTKDNRYYTGITNSIIRRWSEHGKRRGTFLYYHKPLLVVNLEYFESRVEARKREVLIKRIGASKYLKYLKYQPIKFR